MAQQWTQDEIRQLEKLWAEGASMLAIAGVLGRTKGTVAGQIHRRVKRGLMSWKGSSTPARNLPPARGCRWPHGDPRVKASFRWCDAAIVPGPSPYCAEHMLTSYPTWVPGG